MNNRQLAALETKRKLMAAAKNLICEHGLNDTSVEQITETAGVSKGTFYTYFKKKVRYRSWHSAEACSGKFWNRQSLWKAHF